MTPRIKILGVLPPVWWSTSIYTRHEQSWYCASQTFRRVILGRYSKLDTLKSLFHRIVWCHADENVGDYLIKTKPTLVVLFGMEAKDGFAAKALKAEWCGVPYLTSHPRTISVKCVEELQQTIKGFSK